VTGYDIIKQVGALEAYEVTKMLKERTGHGMGAWSTYKIALGKFYCIEENFIEWDVPQNFIDACKRYSGRPTGPRTKPLSEIGRRTKPLTKPRG